MEDILKIVEDFIPEDQKADIKAKIDGTIANFTDKKVKETKRDLSQKFGVNLFEEDVEKAYTNDKFVKRDLLVEKEKELADKIANIDTLTKEVETYKKDKDFNDLSIKLIGKGIKPERIDVIKPLLDNEGTIDERIEKLIAKVPEFFTNPTTNKVVGQSIVPNTNPSKTTSGFEDFINKNKLK